jgi:repressor LexA
MVDLPLFPFKLTARQQQILDLIQNAIARSGAPPSRDRQRTRFQIR